MQLGGVALGGGGGMANVPVFDISGIYNDDAGYHYQWYHFAARARMREANGNTDNHVMWRGNPVPFDTAWSTFIQWVDAVKADASDAPERVKVVQDKPAAAVDHHPTGSTTRSFPPSRSRARWRASPSRATSTSWRQANDAIAVDIASEFVDKVLSPEQRDPAFQQFWSSGDDALLTQTVLALVEDAKTGMPAGSVYGECLGAALVARIARRSGRPPVRQATGKGLSPKLRKRILESIDAYLEGDLSVHRLAWLALRQYRKALR